MDLFAVYATDEIAENEGVWMPFGEGDLLIARSGNKNFTKKLQKTMVKNQRLLDRKDDAAEKLSQDIMVNLIAETVLLGWRGDFSWHGNPLPYTMENAKMVLELKDFRKQVMTLAEDMDAFLAKKEDDAVKNS